jgi:hypothetical protein
MIIEFEHKQAGNCETGVTSNMLRHHGIKNLTEPLVLGMGAGLFFSYLPFVKLQFAPVLSWRVFPGLIFKRINKALGVKMYVKTFKDPEESMKALDQALEQGLPAAVQVGVYDLPYFPPEYRQHYNMHNMVIFGKENNEYLVSDTTLEQTQRISYDALLTVRYPKGPFAPNGKLYYPVEVPQNVDFRPLIVKGIRKTCYEMTQIPFWLVGTKGFRTLAKAMERWPEKLGPQQANYYIGQVLRMLEEIGSGGAGFRYMYGIFLLEASEILNQPWLKEKSFEMGTIANEWRQFAYMGAKNCKHRSNIEVSYGDLAQKLREIAGKEDKLFRDLSKIKL